MDAGWMAFLNSDRNVPTQFPIYFRLLPASLERTRDVSLGTDSCGADLPGCGVITGVDLGVGLEEVRIGNLS